MPLRRRKRALPAAADEEVIPEAAPQAATPDPAPVSTAPESARVLRQVADQLETGLPHVVAHILSKTQLAAAKRGEQVKSLCGDATIKGDAKPNAPLCQKCVLAQFKVDDDKNDKSTREAAASAQATSAAQYTKGVAEGERRGVAQGEQRAMQSIREAAERRAEAELAGSNK